MNGIRYAERVMVAMTCIMVSLYIGDTLAAWSLGRIMAAIICFLAVMVMIKGHES